MILLKWPEGPTDYKSMLDVYLVFLQAVMLVIDKTFQGIKLICLLQGAGLIGYAY